MKYRTTMSPAEYSNWFKRTGVKHHNYPFILAIKSLRLQNDTVPNLLISKHLDVSAVGAGKVCTTLERNGIIEDISIHPLRKDWKLTALGEELHDFIYSRKVGQ